MTKQIDLTEVNADELKNLINVVLKTNLVPMVTSSPGLGKSSIIRQIADDLKLELIDVRLSTADPTYLSGLPFMHDGKAKLMPFNEMFPTEDMEIPKGKIGWLLFLDELTSANRSVQAASYQLVLDRVVGTRKLHNRVKIVAAGNLLDDRAIVNTMSTALQSRMVHLTLKPNVEIWTKNVAIPNHIDFRITAFVNAFPQYLMQFDPEHEEKTFACPRTWAFADKIIKAYGQENLGDIRALLSGTISTSVTTKFLAFCDNMHEVTTLKEVLADPATAKIPSQNQFIWATVTSLAQQVDETNISSICAYVERLTPPMQIIFYRSILIYNKDLSGTPEFTKGVRMVGEMS